MTDAAPQDPAQPQVYAVVYQYGKVASTSTVALLNQLDGVEAVQCHFLGRVALEKILQQVLSPDLSDYFHFHQRGQFVQNMDITHRVNRIRAGKIPGERLLVISCARDPMTWFQSAVTQDITGYLPSFRDIAPDAPDDDALLRATGPGMLGAFADVLTTLGGVDRAVAALALPGFHTDLAKGVWFHPALRDLFLLLTRPFNWFELHYEKALDHTLAAYTETDGFLRRDDGEATFAILKYEDLEPQLGRLIDSLGLGPLPPLPRENTSGAKPHAATLSEIFQGPEADRLRTLFAGSRYSQSFGYGPRTAAATPPGH
ncbi:hypothetical protein [Pseudoruegeria sp. SK021]|uniref:hypothetical protein n=1 Tax=Pseudoruegeria sp. SK021 TaxID=1933035 RepID=UPI000A255993|nr:hypothetical protein [Pseudoruegeria sp. SK021]OSP56496.1 hypothetical protein BV911_00595 [Pseudoruegeria sp. SK021]